MGSWNIGTLTEKSIELAKILQKRKINIACVRETRWVGSKARDADGFKLCVSGCERDKNVVGILVDRYLRELVVEVMRVNDRLVAIKLVVGGSTLNLISAYAPQVDLDEEIYKRRFSEEFDGLVRGIPLTEKLFIGGDFNGHIGATSGGMTVCMAALALELGTVEELGEVIGYRSLDEQWRHELEEVQEEVEAKQAAYLTLIESMDDEARRKNREGYRRAKKEAKLAVTATKTVAFGRFYKELGAKGGEGQEAIHVSQEGRDIVFGDLEYSEIRRDFGYCRRIRVEEVERAMRKMHGGRATRPDEIPVKFWKNAGRADRMDEAEKLFDRMRKEKISPDVLTLNKVLLSRQTDKGHYFSIFILLFPGLLGIKWLNFLVDISSKLAKVLEVY
uniref:Craniofacial development protein 2-like n=1 Tax=Nicotiana tabacum TaxID=4097 RepID=A0A1S3Y223_TOBAC|nr:PREDICTED: uncharacterized protein LOC107771431 [Nicotiana tabacum]XP_018631371.1 uncharacterized protein LOC108947649 [Nicotiana tomentosiformis]